MKMFNIPASSGEEVVYTDHVCPAAEQTVAQMRSEKASAARHQNARFRQHLISSGIVHFFGRPDVPEFNPTTLGARECRVCWALPLRSRHV
jgi:hypothetical protein